ncbi:SAF domain-containing protein [Microbacterium sp. ASV49]|uniref:SAF domain-containing protein n=1 Tax=Microbacterium candidum TaxID=3041922 RepID=A0ABT7N0Z1_9MICO|nr:SAF domain-containing protein [Microbacterium sp. ASV49]MDL9980374.1 SAF domain-containing protein [Microbacterium sp. ASV49]
MTVVEPARPRRRAPWGDLRFLLGIVLVVASIGGVWFVVAASRQTAPVYAAAHTLTPGQRVQASDLEIVQAALGTTSAVYLAPGAGLAEGAVATRTVRKGELVPRAAVGDAGATGLTTVVVRSTVDVPASLDAGSSVEVWAAPLEEKGAYGEPRILVPDATVVSVTRDDSVIGSAGAALELVVPRADVSDVLAAMAGKAALSVVPTNAAR